MIIMLDIWVNNNWVATNRLKPIVWRWLIRVMKILRFKTSFLIFMNTIALVPIMIDYWIVLLIVYGGIMLRELRALGTVCLSQLTLRGWFVHIWNILITWCMRTHLWLFVKISHWLQLWVILVVMLAQILFLYLTELGC